MNDQAGSENKALDPLDPIDRIAIEAYADEQAKAAADDILINGEPEPEIDPAQIWAQVPKQVGALLGMAFPELKAAYSDAACLQWGQGMAAVAQKYEWDASETISKWAPELMLITATIPLAVPTYTAFKARKAESEKKPVQLAGPANVVDLNNPMNAEPGGFSVPN